MYKGLSEYIRDSHFGYRKSSVDDVAVSLQSRRPFTWRLMLTSSCRTEEFWSHEILDEGVIILLLLRRDPGYSLSRRVPNPQLARSGMWISSLQLPKRVISQINMSNKVPPWIHLRTSIRWSNRWRMYSKANPWRDSWQLQTTCILRAHNLFWTQVWYFEYKMLPLLPSVRWKRQLA